MLCGFKRESRGGKCWIFMIFGEAVIISNGRQVILPCRAVVP